MKNVRELSDYHKRMLSTRSKAISTLDLILRTGHPISIKIRTSLDIPGHPFPEDLKAVPLPEPPKETLPISVRKELTALRAKLTARRLWGEEIKEELAKAIRMRTTSTEINNELITKVEKLEEKGLDLYLANKELTELLDIATKPGEKSARDTTPIADILHTEIVSKDTTEARPPAQLQREAGTIIISPDPVPGPGLPYEKPGDKPTTVMNVDMQLSLDETPRLNVRSSRPKNSNLTVPEVWQLRRYLKSGRRNTWIEKKMGMSSAAVSQAKGGRTYKKVPKEPGHKSVKVHAGEGVISQKKNK